MDEMIREAELSDIFFNSTEADLIFHSYDERCVRSAAQMFKVNNKWHPWSVDKLTEDFMSRV